jgi:hypothetical protein
MAPTPHRQFDPALFRSQHRPEAVEPLRDGAQTRIDGRTRSVVHGPDSRVAYDSQREHGEAGIFDRSTSIEHGMCWVEAQIRMAMRREQLEDERRFMLADVEAASQKREQDLRAQRKALTESINRERKVQAALAAEARDPKVKIEFRGGIEFEVLDEPSVFDGTLDAEGRELPKPKPRGVSRDRDGGGPPPPKTEQPPAPAANDPAASAAMTARADAYQNGNAKQSEVIAALEGVLEYVEISTLAAISLGEYGRKKRRAALDNFLGETPIARFDVFSRPKLLELINGDGEADFAAAAMVTSTSTSTSDLKDWLSKIEDVGVLRWALAREQARSKPREKLLELIESRIELAKEWSATE